jgi:hypothetical protein
MRTVVALVLTVVLVRSLAAQSTGAIAGRVKDDQGHSLGGTLVWVDGGRQGATTDTGGLYRVREVRSGWHRVRAARIGYRPVILDSVLVRGGETVTLDFALAAQALTLDSLVVRGEVVDRILDPLVTADVQRITGVEIKRLPVSTVEEAVALSAGAVGESYRGGRIGESAFVLDGLGVKNQLDASTNTLGIQVPTEILTEASLVTNAFSARYGQALSGLINVVTMDAGDRWSGRVAYEGDRPLPAAADHGLDRAVITLDGPLGGGIGFLGVINAQGLVDNDPVNAPAPTDPRDPRFAEPWVLPHNSGERLDVAGKLIIPVSERNTVRLFGLRSTNQALLFDPAFKYDPTYAPASRLVGDLFSAHLQHTAAPTAVHPFGADLRMGYFDQEFMRGQLTNQPTSLVGAFTGQAFHFVDEGIARAKDTVAARGALPGFSVPQLSENTPWGVPAFFLGNGSRGELAWNRYREIRGQADFTLAAGPTTDLNFGGEFSQQHVETFQRISAYLPTGDSVPPATASDFKPQSAALYGETQIRATDFAIVLGLRYDQFDPRSGTLAQRFGPHRSLSPRLSMSTVLNGATFVASWGHFAQAPDFQYLVDASFDDTLRTGRFRQGNPNLGFETATQYEFSLRVRPSDQTSVRINGYVKRLDGLVASVPLNVNPDSSIFGNNDFGTVKGVELIVEREMKDWWGARVSYTLQSAEATSTNPFILLNRFTVDSQGDTIHPAKVQFPLDYDRRHSITVVLQARVPDGAGPRVLGQSVFAGLEGALIGRYASGLPYSQTTSVGDTIVGLPNSKRLPTQSSVDLLIRRPIRVFGWQGGVYLDVRNVLDTRNIEAVRRDIGQPGASAGDIQQLAVAAYNANPQAIPYESPRYRAWADLNHDGVLSGPGELMPLYLAAATDYSQPLFSYGPPRLFRIGVELEF